MSDVSIGQMKVIARSSDRQSVGKKVRRLVF